MFARSIAMRLKPNRVTEFVQTLQNEVDPLLRKEQGFRGHIAFVVPNGTEAVAISFWDRKESRISHNDERCQVLVTLAKLVKSPPDVRVCEISNSTSDNGELLDSFVHRVEGAPHVEIYEVSRSIFRAIAADGRRVSIKGKLRKQLDCLGARPTREVVRGGVAKTRFLLIPRAHP